MSPRSLALAAVSIAALPVAAVGALLWHGTRLRRAFWVEIDPYEVDAQLRQRND